MTADGFPGLAEDGYVVLDLLGEAAVARLLTLFESLGIASDVPFVATCNDFERPVAAEVDAQLRGEIGPVIASLLPDNEIFLTSFISKGVGPYGPLDFHQDLTYTDERTVRSTLLWIPLVDVGPENGALQVVPGSHRWTDGIRPGGLPELPTKELQEEFAGRSVTVPMHAGQALVYDAALVHGSTPNTSDRHRPVLAIATAPRGARLVHFHHLEPAPAMTGHEVDPSYYVVQTLFDTPVGYPVIEQWGPQVDVPALRRHLHEPVAAPAASSEVGGRTSRWWGSRSRR